MWIRRIISALFLLLLVCGISRAEITAEWPGTMYVSPDRVTVQWQAPDDDRITHYEAQAVWIDQDPEQVIELGTTTDTQITVERPRTGHFVIRVRSVSDSHDMVSEWAVSSEEEHALPGPWRIYFSVPAVGGITIE